MRPEQPDATPAVTIGHGVRLVEVKPDEADTRVDRWFKRLYPGLTHGHLEKLLRTGQVRVDGGRVKAATRLAAGQTVRVPPMDFISEAPPSYTPAPRAPRQSDIDALRACVLYRDQDMIAINKPPGLAVQGGTNTDKHVDGLLDALRFDAAERPRLVHRLDKDTSGVLLLARNLKAATWLTQAFREKTTRKTYWALTVGVPKPRQGRIDLAIGKATDGPRDKVVADAEDGKSAVTYYSVVEHAGGKIAWLAMLPVTGRTHQLRVHAAEIGTPILGDGKYGGVPEHLPGLDHVRKLHLHAHSIVVPRPGGGRPVVVTAPLPPHMADTWRFFGFDTETDEDPFAALDLG
ncbi:MAG TPA: RluA family pseudouridine synthase [Stellaceae bacterium]|nr:RluA family pseudouridine synthase [Stellaceae bacterium]